ncbi:MAG: DUF1800 domain-containing protein [Paracoccaceae bacterium]
MLTRRAFHQSLVALAMTTALPRIAFASADDRMDEVFLNRLTFGATDADRTTLRELGREGWLAAQLAMPVMDDGLQQRLADTRLHISYEAGDDGVNGAWEAVDELRPLGYLDADPAAQVDLLNFEMAMEYTERQRPAQEVIAASLIRAVHARAQLREVMTQFWHNHFHVNAVKDEMTAVFFPSYDKVMRENALGSFRVMLGEVARSPAMLYYLNNADSTASPANENFARELLELHTLGAENYVNDTAPNWRDVPGAADGLSQAYIDQDVYEVARAFTGWSVGDGRYISEGIEAPRTGRFNYVEAWHDPYQKRILGVEFPPHQGPMVDAEQVMDLLSRHPGTARYVSRKLIRRLLTDDPDSAMVDRIAEVFLTHADAPDQIARVVQAIVTDPLFTSTPPTKFRRPFEFLAGLYRATGVEVTSPDMPWDWQLQQAGWKQHSYGPPTGHPDRASRWSSASTMARMVDYALYAHDDWFGCTKTALADIAPKGASFDVIGQFWTERLLGPGVATDFTILAEAFGVSDRSAPMELTPDEVQGLSATFIAFAAVSTDFMLR